MVEEEFAADQQVVGELVALEQQALGAPNDALLGARKIADFRRRVEA